MKRAQSAAYWTAPSLFCLIVYWYGVKSWFRADDFAWLGLGLEIHDPSSFWRVMFEPMAQGTIRTLSERAYFMGFHALFGLDALPYRICAVLTQCASLVLLTWIALKLTGSRTAAFWAPVLWTANSALVIAMTWCSAYNQILCGFFLLLAFALFLKYEETGRRRYYWWQFAVFLLGFGALEVNVVYPALVATYLILRRKPWKSTIPLFAGSLIFAIVHFAVAPRQTGGSYYSLHFDHAIPATLWTYWKWVLVPNTWWDFEGRGDWRGVLMVTVLSALLIGFAIFQARRKRWAALMFLCWFGLLIAPVLPLKHHVSDYYLTLPAMGAAGLGGIALAESWRAGWAWRIVGVACLAVYLWIDVPQSRHDSRWYYDVARGVKMVVLGVARAHELHPSATILLHNVGDDIFNHAIVHGPFRLLDDCRVYLTPEADAQIANHPDNPGSADFVLPAGPTWYGLDREQILVYEPAGDHLKNITEEYVRTSRSQTNRETPRRVEAGNSLFSYLLGPTWYPIEANYRWMPRRATVHVGGPRANGEKLYIHGYCPQQLTGAGPVSFKLSVDGETIDQGEINGSETWFDRSSALPASTVGKESVEVGIELNRTLRRPEDGRELSVAFGLFAIR